MELYWILRLPHLHAFFDLGGGILTFIGFGLLVVHIMAFHDSKYSMETREMVRWISASWIMASCLFFLALFIPTKTDLALMYGWDALKSNNVQEVIEILKDKLK